MSQGRRTSRLRALVLALLALVVALSPCGAARADHLDPAVHQRSIIVVSDDNYPPYIFRDETGALRGILVDLWHEWEEATGIAVTLKAMDWGQAQDLMRHGGADVIDTIFYNEARAQTMDFSRPYARLDVPVFVHRDLGGIATPGDLHGFTIGVKRGDAVVEVLKSHGIHSIKEYDSYLAVIQAARRHEIRLFSVDKPPAVYYLYKFGMEDEYRSAFVLYTGEFHRAVRKGRADLLRQMEEGFEAIPPARRKAIEDKWLGAALVDREHLLQMLYAGLAIAAVVLVLLGFNLALRRRVRAKTAELAATVESLRESESRFRAIFDSASDCIFIHDSDTGRILDVNARACAMFGYTREEIRALAVADLSSGEPPYDQAGAQERIRQALEGHAGPFEWRSKAKGGRLFWSEVFTSRVMLGGKTCILVSLQDITQRRQGEERLRQSEEKFARLFRLSPDSVVLAEEETGRIVDVNETFERHTGYGRDEALGRTAAELGLFADETGRLAFQDLMARSGRVDNYEFESRGRDGTLTVCLLSSQLIDIGEKRYRLSIMRDITGVKRMQEMMVQTEKMISMGGIAAGIAHEINNPLGIILQGAQTLAQRLSPDNRKNLAVAGEVGLDLALMDQYARRRQLPQFIEDIQSAAVRASAIIRHMLDFSRKSESRRSVCSLAEVMDRAVNLAMTDYDLKKNYDFKKIDIIRQVDPHLPQVACTETEIEQVLLNVLRNAAQAMALADPPVAAPRIVLRISAKPGAVRLEVADNGPGMPAEVRRRIFEPFFTTKAPGVGTGLGLSVSYFIVTKGHGGYMTVDSAPGEGTRVVIELPALPLGEPVGSEPGGTP